METLTLERLVVVAHNGARLVDNVTLTLRRGEVLALVGGSGSGKSLTCAAALDVLPPGTHRLAGSMLSEKGIEPFDALRGRQVATILQNPRSAFNPVLSMYAHIVETLRALDNRQGADRPEMLEALSDVGLEQPERVLQLYPFEMSGGMLQRVMIALALLSGAPFLIADEPTTDLDLVVQSKILDLLEHIVAERRLGMLLVTHDMAVVARLADRVAIIDRGRIVEQGDAWQIYTAPRHAVTRTLLAAHFSLYQGGVTR